MRDYIAEINSNPVTKYVYDREMDQRHYARRLAKQSKWSYKSMDDIMRFVRLNWNNSSEPTIVGSRATDEGFTNRMTFRQQLHSARSARHGAVERAAEDGNYQTRKFTQEFVDSVKSARNLKGVTQQELAIAINCTANEITRLERGVLNYDGDLKSRLHNFLNL